MRTRGGRGPNSRFSEDGIGQSDFETTTEEDSEDSEIETSSEEDNGIFTSRVKSDIKTGQLLALQTLEWSLHVQFKHHYRES